MNDILAAYEKARFEKSAVEPPASPLRGAEMNDAMRRIRDAIEQSIRDESQARGSARETAEWGASQARTPAESSPWVTSALLGTGVAGAGAGIESHLARSAPRPANLAQAVQKVMDTEKDFGAWAKRRLSPGSDYAVPTTAPAMAQALQRQPAAQAPNAGALRRTWDQIKKRVGVESPRLSKVVRKAYGRGVDPSVVDPVLKTGGKPSGFAEKLTEKTVTGTGRQKMRKAIMGHEAVTKGQGMWKRSPALRGALKGIGVASLTYIIPYIWNKLMSDVAPGTEEAQVYVRKQMQLVDMIRAWREKQFEQLAGAQRPEDVVPVPWAPS